MDQAMNVNDWYLFQGVGSVIGFHRVVGPRLLGLTPDESAIAVAVPKARVVFRELSRLLGPATLFCRRDHVARGSLGCSAARLARANSGMGDANRRRAQSRGVA
jgi:hypothetical protein